MMTDPPVNQTYNIEMTEYLLRKGSASGSIISDADSDIDEFINLTVDPKDLIRRRNSSFHRIKSIFVDYSDKHDLEQRFMVKLDFFLLSSATLGYLVKNLNQSNMGTAYVNGMDEYYNMDKNQYNYLTACWSAGYFLGQLGSAHLLHKFRPRLFLGTLEVIWGLLTLSMVYCNSLSTIYLIRFLVGLTESAFFPSMEYLLGSWFSSEEITKRSTLFALSSSFSRIITGPIQVMILDWYDEETSKFQPFQYLFLFDVMVSVPVGILTMFFNPDTPTTTNNYYWNHTDRLVALERRRRAGALSRTNINDVDGFSLNTIKLFLSQWETYLFPLLFVCYNNTGLSNIAITTYLRDSLHYSPTAYNLYPSMIAVMSMVVALTVGYLSDYFHGTKNYIFIASYFLCVSTGSFILAFYWDHLNVVFHISLYFLIAVPSSYGQPQIFSWVNRTFLNEDLKRHFIVVVTNSIPYITSLIHIVVWDTRSQPRFKLGYIYNLLLSMVGLGATILTLSFTRKKLHQSKRLSVTSYGSNDDLIGEV